MSRFMADQSGYGECPKGQSSTEYGLGIGLVALLTVGALHMLGNTLNISASNMIPDHSPSVALPPVGGVIAIDRLPADQKISPGADGYRSRGILKISDFTIRMAGTVATLGANGTTFELSGQLKAIAVKLQQSGEISDAEANKLLALANQGFRLAELEKQVEEASKHTGSTHDFLQSSIQFDGKRYTIPEVAALIGFGTQSDLIEDIRNNPNYMLETETALPETLAFINLYHDAISGANIQNSEARGVVSQLSSEISYLTDAVCDLIMSSYDPSVALDDLKKNTASQATVYDATAICYVGNGACRAVH